MAEYLGDFRIGKTIHHKFMTVNASGKPTTLGDSPSLLVYVNASVSGVASGLTLTTDFDARTGLSHVQFLATTSVTGVTSGTEFQIVVATGSVSGISLNGYPICDFSLMNRSALMPTTVGNTLAVNSSGSAAIDWAQVSNAGSTVSLTATTLFTVTNVTNNVGAVVTACNTVVPANVTTYSTAIAANVTAASTNIGAVVTASSINIGAIVTACNTVVPANVTAASINIGAVVTACNTVVPANVTAFATVTAVQSAVAIAVWDATLASHLNAGSTGLALNSSSSAGDPWNTAVPGAYGAGSAGFILGTNLNAKVGDVKTNTDKLQFNASN